MSPSVGLIVRNKTLSWGGYMSIRRRDRFRVIKETHQEHIHIVQRLTEWYNWRKHWHWHPFCFDCWYTTFRLRGCHVLWVRLSFNITHNSIQYMHDAWRVTNRKEMSACVTTHYDEMKGEEEGHLVSVNVYRKWPLGHDRCAARVHSARRWPFCQNTAPLTLFFPLLRAWIRGYSLEAFLNANNLRRSIWEVEHQSMRSALKSWMFHNIVVWFFFGLKG